jgi:hypothetical protein
MGATPFYIKTSVCRQIGALPHACAHQTRHAEGITLNGLSGNPKEKQINFIILH